MANRSVPPATAMDGVGGGVETKFVMSSPDFLLVVVRQFLDIVGFTEWSRRISPLRTNQTRVPDHETFRLYSGRQRGSLSRPLQNRTGPSSHRASGAGSAMDLAT